MIRKKCQQTLPDFTLTAPSIWEYLPTLTANLPSNNGDSPSLILLCTWTGAQRRYIAKHTAVYRTLFPSTRIMVVTTTAKDLCFRDSTRKQTRVHPAVNSISQTPHLSNGIFLHAFSEGGTNKACELAEAYYQVIKARLPVTALCLDSSPGHPRFLRLCNALNKSLPPIPVLRHTGVLFGSAVLDFLWFTYHVVKGYENNVITRTRRRVVDPKFFDLAAPRCYLFSKDDALIAWHDVKAHVDDSIELGVPVTDVVFEGSGHVGHARMQPDRYWGAVEQTWKNGTETGEASVRPQTLKSPLRREHKTQAENAWTSKEKTWAKGLATGRFTPIPTMEILKPYESPGKQEVALLVQLQTETMYVTTMSSATEECQEAPSPASFSTAACVATSGTNN